MDGNQIMTKDVFFFLESFIDIKLNMIVKVRGGGIHEDDIFYNTGGEPIIIEVNPEIECPIHGLKPATENHRLVYLAT